MELKLPTLKYRRIRGDMIEVYKLLMNKYDDNGVHLDMNTDTRTRGHTKKLVFKRCHYNYDVGKETLPSPMITLLLLVQEA